MQQRVGCLAGCRIGCLEAPKTDTFPRNFIWGGGGGGRDSLLEINRGHLKLLGTGLTLVQAHVTSCQKI